jgi:hypothetical protein
MRSSSSTFLAAISALLPVITALGQNATVTTTADSSLLQLAGSGINGQILVSSEDWWGVIRAADDLAHDFGRVTGKNLTLGNWSPKNSTPASPTSTATPKRQVVARAESEDAEPKGWQNVPESGPQNGPRNITRSTAAGSQTTVYYWYNPVTSFINVSHSILLVHVYQTDHQLVYCSADRLEFHWSNPLQQRAQQENCDHSRNGRQITTHQPTWFNFKD